MLTLHFNSPPIASLDKITQIETQASLYPFAHFIVSCQTGTLDGSIQRKIGILKEDQFQKEEWSAFAIALLTFESLPSLTVLKFKTPFFNEEKIISVLKKSPALHTLEMAGEKFKNTNLLLEGLGLYCPQLKILNISQSQHIDHQGVKNLANCKNLKEVNLSNCLSISDASIEVIACAAKENLEALSLFNCPLLTDKALQCLYVNCLNIKYLNIGYNKMISSSQINRFISQCQFLEELFMEKIDLNMDKIFDNVECPNLQKLSLRHTNTTDSDLLILALKAPNLSFLNLSLCRRVSLNGLLAGIAVLRNLKSLDISDLFTLEEIFVIKNKFPFLKLIPEYEVYAEQESSCINSICINGDR
ncbi:MAG: hypothetical protein H0V82_10170 [Candidatus Protochlamydia sp.]|nr:hypothetical protein [Candidatus Protochlamydia sp.]